MAGKVVPKETTGFFHRRSVRRGWRQPISGGFVMRPEPFTIGSIPHGRQILAGHLMLAGHVVELAHGSLWDYPALDLGFDEARHGFGWLDDLAAVATPAARRKAQGWLWDWIAQNRAGTGPAWRAAPTGRRALRLVFHAFFLLHSADDDQRRLFLQMLTAHMWHLSRRAEHAPDGMGRVEALSAWLILSLCLEGGGMLATPALSELERSVTRMVDDHGGVASRNPEGLLDLACHLQWVEDALTGAGQTFPSTLAGVRDSLALTLRSLRHADGALPRFHGGGAGRDGLLDRVLAGSPVTTRRDGRSAMGFARLSARRSSVIMDASAPPTEGAALTGHASTLAFELTSGRRPIIVNCGPGQHFGSDWRRAARATAGHSVLCVEAYSSAQLGKPDPGTGLEPLTNAPAKVLCDFLRLDGADRIQGVHSGYDASHGLTHARMLDLDHDGRCLQGEDRLMVASDAARPRFDAAMRAGGGGVPVYIRFHLHPDVAAGRSSDHKTATLALRSGERWEFTHEGGFNLSIEPSVYLDPDEMTPLASKQVVLSGRAMKYATPIRWSLRKTDDTAQAVRDLAQGDVDTDL